METLHKIAGVQDAADLKDSSTQDDGKPTQPVQLTANSAPINAHTSATTPTRASLPLDRRPSSKSLRSALKQDTDAPPVPHLPLSASNGEQSPTLGGTPYNTSPNSDETDFVWGTSHPCFPHPNPYCAMSSEAYNSTRIIRVKRDYLVAGDLYPQFANLYPEILDPLVTDAEFRVLIAEINARLKKVYDPFQARAWVDAALGLMTGFLWDDLGWTGKKSGEKRLTTWIEGWNLEKEREGKMVRVMDLRKSGLMALEFVIPDPEMD
ncbi:hypothetical protein K470DRAFT_257484 [Piedraia hortae CBS 480.64]|uniref:Ras modification protein ERF4 n=1 Tax=Piedraia hortae CBS 480.64 TaxID=1314780 RepID=A0A6A7C048_9PEZI|nr:hypothetical protein K470DRAFT_257484 [Piedraia hortae CBS 480.64]